MLDEPLLGANIRNARIAKDWSQAKLSSETQITPTAISAYENDKKRPGLDTLAHISTALNVSLDDLYYGDESQRFIHKSSSDGRLIVNSIYELWKCGVLNSRSLDVKGSDWDAVRLHHGYVPAIKRLLETLNEFNAKRKTYSDPELYLEQVFESVANEIDEKREMNSFPF